MTDDIERIDNLAGVRHEDSLNPMARSKRQKRREEKSDDDLTERSKKRPADEPFELEVDGWDQQEASEQPVDSGEAAEEKDDATVEPPTEEHDDVPAEPEQGIDVKI